MNKKRYALLVDALKTIIKDDLDSWEGQYYYDGHKECSSCFNGVWNGSFGVGHDDDCPIGIIEDVVLRNG